MSAALTKQQAAVAETEAEESNFIDIMELQKVRREEGEGAPQRQGPVRGRAGRRAVEPGGSALLAVR
jgi:hypothetical protein